MELRSLGASVCENPCIVACDFSKKKKKAAVLYHYPCPDGVFAALAAHMYFTATSTPALFFPNTVYSPVRVEELPLGEINDIYLLDFVGPPGFIHQISPKVERVVVLDHHKTALEMFSASASTIDKNVFQVIDMDRSGATIAYDFFKEKILSENINVDCGQDLVISEFERVRPLFDYIQDGDLWRWRLCNSKAFNSGLKDLNIEYDPKLNPSLFEQLRALDLNSIISQGLESLSHKQRLINQALEHSYEIALGGGTYGHCLAVNANSIPGLRSELGHQLANKSRGMELRGIGAVVYRVPELENDNMLKISLRSVEKEDTTPVSKEFGGGGHGNASSFMLSTSEFDRWKV